ncbi:unnamed protein product [Adineta ricciae]|uniref:ADP ribosyltransferase domain-containing protein n=1 Tax=Adineta ricciae TaxID=249248 RepID=A0A814EWA8_ADIRI|nr:unnamed protein product [Adineta ricciae]CAF0990715.1 unnamed protein product [Adineta ricciae]
MATSKKLSTTSSSTSVQTKSTVDTIHNQNLESVACLWLDQNIHSTNDNRTTQEELRQVINYLQTFDDSDQCEEYIRQITHEKVVLIVSGSFGQNIVPRLHSLPQFVACYVFCSNKEANERWANNYSKVKGVFIKRSELVDKIAQDQTARNKVEDSASISVISNGPKSLQAHNAIFMWFQLFIEVLLRMHHKSTDRKELIDICKKNYNGNRKEMAIIKEFETTYKSDNAIWWYTRDACFYRMMNKALRVQDYDILFPLRFLITDIAKQLKDGHEKFIRTSDIRTVIRVYRGQAIGHDELNLMRNSLGEYLSMNSFLSTSRSRATAIDFIRMIPMSDEHQRILFEIEIDPRLKTKAFADIKEMSYYQNEDEVLMMLGALFRIQKVIEDEKNRMWIANITLASEDDYRLKETFSFMKDKIGDETNLDSLGRILLEMGEYRQAEKCYRRMQEEFRLGMSDAQSGIGWALYKCDEYDESLEHLQEALSIRRHLLGENHVKVAECFFRIGGVYWREDMYDKALSNMKKSIELYEKALEVDSAALAKTYNGIAVIYACSGETNLALEYYNKTLEVQLANLPPNHPDIAITYNNLGWFHGNIGNISEALKYYKKSLEISRKILPPTHEEIIRTENNIEEMKEQMKT